MRLREIDEHWPWVLRFFRALLRISTVEVPGGKTRRRCRAASCWKLSRPRATFVRRPRAPVWRKVGEGLYGTEDEVIADALRLMQVRDEFASIKRDRLKDAIERGYEDAAAGKLIRLETDDQIDTFFAEL